MKIKGAIFDLDGTLLDSMSVWDNIGDNYLKNHGIIPRSDVREALRPMSLIQAAEYFQSDYGILDSVNGIVDEINKMVEHFYCDVVKPKDGVKELLQNLKENCVKMSIATATDRHLVEAALKRNNIFNYFDSIFTCAEVGSGKDCADIYYKALDSLDEKKENVCIFEDALHAIETAKNAGFFVVAVYDNSTDAQQSEIKQITDVYLKSYRDWNQYKNYCIAGLSE